MCLSVCVCVCVCVHENAEKKKQFQESTFFLRREMGVRENRGRKKP